MIRKKKRFSIKNIVHKAVPPKLQLSIWLGAFFSLWVIFSGAMELIVPARSKRARRSLKEQAQAKISDLNFILIIFNLIQNISHF